MGYYYPEIFCWLRNLEEIVGCVEQRFFDVINPEVPCKSTQQVLRPLVDKVPAKV
jgi:hypothetical protein